MRVTVWGENVHERRDPSVAAIYPEGMHEAIAAGLRERLGGEAEVRTATLDEPEQGLGEEVLGATDVLVWWGHVAHGEVADAIVDRVQERVLAGMGLIVLHSGHFSKIFRRLMGTSCTLRWREAGEKERVWNVAPGHPITDGIGEHFEIPHSEMYGERFDIPEPDKLIFLSWFAGGDVFRSGCTFERGAGRIFYFSPGDQEYPVYHHPDVQRVLANAVRWAAPRLREAPAGSPNSPVGWWK